jgi:hypothetical protein
MTPPDTVTCLCGEIVVRVVDPYRPWFVGLVVSTGTSGDAGAAPYVDGEGRTVLGFNIQTGQNPVERWRTHTCRETDRPQMAHGSDEQKRAVALHLDRCNTLRRFAGVALWARVPTLYAVAPTRYGALRLLEGNERSELFGELDEAFAYAVIAAPGHFEGWYATVNGRGKCLPVTATVDAANLQAVLTVDLRGVPSVEGRTVRIFHPEADPRSSEARRVLRAREYWADFTVPLHRDKAPVYM